MILQIIRDGPSLEIKMRTENGNAGAGTSGSLYYPTRKIIFNMDRKRCLLGRFAVKAYPLGFATSAAYGLCLVTLERHISHSTP
jgi:hypothetical protein